MSQCKTCKAPIMWATMESGKPMPLNPEPVKMVVLDEKGIGRVKDCYASHFVTCPDANKHRKQEALF